MDETDKVISRLMLDGLQDEGLTLKILVELEKIVDEEGWDQPHQLVAIERIRVPEGFQASGLPLPDETVAADINTALRLVAGAVRRYPGAVDMCAWVVCTEGWSWRRQSREEVDQLLAMTREEREHDASKVEVRTLTALTQTDHVLSVTRTRHDNSVTAFTHPLDDEYQGDVVLGLQAIARAARGNVN
jgi:hypothetical protein